jgi:hypothetical protein
MGVFLKSKIKLAKRKSSRIQKRTEKVTRKREEGKKINKSKH